MRYMSAEDSLRRTANHALFGERCVTTDDWITDQPGAPLNIKLNPDVQQLVLPRKQRTSRELRHHPSLVGRRTWGGGGGVWIVMSQDVENSSSAWVDGWISRKC